MARKANKDELYELHRAVAQYYLDAVNSGEELSSGTLAAINAFLKNNDVSMDVIEESPEQNLSNKLRLLIANNQEEEVA